MPKYEVSMNTGNIIVVEVEAENQEDAIKKAMNYEGKLILSYVLKREYYKSKEVKEA